MDENNSSEASPNPVIDKDMVNPNAKTYEMLKNDTIDNMSVGNIYSEAHNEMLLNEASKIFQMGVEKDFAIWEKNKIIQDAMETIENMKKNIYHIQTEYEKLDQNYQKEISNSAEALKRNDVTRNMIESAVHYSNILAVSIKQLEDDKFKIAEFYNEIHMRQEQEEENRKKMENIVKEMQDFTETGVSIIIAEKVKTEQKLNALINNLSQNENKLKREIDEKIKLEGEVERLKDEVQKLRSNLVSEQTNRIKYQIIQSQFKKRAAQQKVEDGKTLKNQKALYKRKLKVLKCKMKKMREKVDKSEESISNYLSRIDDLERQVIDLNNNLEKASKYHAKEAEKLEEKLKKCLLERGHIDDLLRTMENEKISETRKINQLIEENMTLTSAQEAMKLKLEAKQDEMEKVQEEKSHLERKVEELLLEINCKTKEINDLTVEIQSHNAEELFENIKIYEEKLFNCDNVEKNLRDEIARLNETMSKECSENERLLLENSTKVQQLEKEVSELRAEKEAAENELKQSYTEYAQVKNELTVKSADLDKITQEFEVKMKMVSDEAELSEGYRINLEKEKQLNLELLQRVQQLENEKAALDRDLSKAFEREKSLNQDITKEKKDIETTIRKLHSDLEQGKELFKRQEEKLNRAENEILEMEKLSEKLKLSEETVNSLKKSLELSEANAEAYKVVINKLERESANRKNTDNETIKRLQSEINQLKQLNQKNENFNILLETPKSRQNRGVNKNENENVDLVSKKTPTTSRRLLSTPKRLLGSPYVSPNFKSISPIMKTRDPYEYDSDCSLERLDPDKILNNFQTRSKRGMFTSSRKK